MKGIVNFLKEAVELTGQIAELTGAKDYPQKRPKGYVIKTGSSPVKKFLSNTKRTELTLTVNVEPVLGEPIHLSLSASLKRGGSNDSRRKDSTP